MENKDIIHEIIPELELSSIINSNSQFPEEAGFQAKRNLQILDHHNSILQINQSIVHFHYNIIQNSDKLIVLEESKEETLINKIKIHYRNTSAMFKENETQNPFDAKSKKENKNNLRGGLENEHYKQMLKQEFRGEIDHETFDLLPIQKHILYSNKEFFLNFKKGDHFIFSFRIITKDSFLFENLANALLLSFYLYSNNCLKMNIFKPLFYFKSLHLVPQTISIPGQSNILIFII